MQTLLQLAGPLHLLARGGGGGSGGGGGGGGGGGSLIVAIGYVPTHFATRWCMQRYSARVALTVGIIVAVLVSIPTFWFDAFIGLIVAVSAGVGIHSGFNDWWGKLRKRFKVGKQNMDFAASKDPAWQEDAVQKRVQQVFYDYQKDWSDFNVQHMQTYLEARYFQHAQLMMAALYQMGRRNVVGHPDILSINPVDVIDAPIDDNDAFSVLIEAQADDRLIETATDEVIYKDTSKFTELWWFDRNGNNWDLKRIDQATSLPGMMEPSLERFARANGMFYSLDWGWLLLPRRGRLFSRASFKGSDVNNHVIGNWNGLIVQMYTYVPLQKSAENYLIAQLTLPKSYGGIIIKRKGGRWNWNTDLFAPRGYQKVSMEWPDFNKRYTVYATDVDQVTSFELLNPKFMADLYDKQLPFSIEVVDNVVYMYAPQANTVVSGTYDRYAALLDVLQAAYKELYK